VIYHERERIKEKVGRVVWGHVEHVSMARTRAQKQKTPVCMWEVYAE
jgi:hypothetical protein